MFSYEPDGCFVAEMYGRPVGNVFTVNYGRFGWIGFLIVKSDFRRRGIGTVLMKQAMDYLLSHRVRTVRLEAVLQIAGLYRRLGFMDEYESLRFVGDNVKTEFSSSHQVDAIEREEIIELSEFDAEYFGANRIRVLEKLYQDSPQGCFASASGSRITGYIMRREKEEGYTIGPWICSPGNPEIAQELLIECLKTMGADRKVYVGVPAVNKTAVRTLESLGFRQYSKSIRMYFGKRVKAESVEGLFAIAGPEKG
jgi:ribosomal protein S18 acetylase RimI-like enzyme